MMLQLTGLGEFGATNAEIDAMIKVLDDMTLRYAQVPRIVHSIAIPTEHDITDDDTGEPFLDEAFVSVQQGAPFAFFGRNIVAFDGRVMRAAHKVWREKILPLLGLGKAPPGKRVSDLPQSERDRILEERAGPFGPNADTIAEELPLIARVRALLVAEKTTPTPPPPVTLVADKPKKGRGTAIALGLMAGALVIGGLVYVSRQETMR